MAGRMSAVLCLLAALVLAGCGKDEPVQPRPPDGGVKDPDPKTKPVPVPAPTSADDPASLAPRAGESIEAAVERFKKTEMGRKVLAKNLTALAVARDPRAFKMLLLLADDREFDPPMVLEALGQVDNPANKPAAAEKARAHFADRSIAAVGAALNAYARLKGDAGVGDISGFIRTNWNRPDGYGEQVCSSAVQALGAVRTPAAVGALVAELQRVGEPGWLPDYGSVVVATLARQRSPEVRPALMAYAEGLAAKMPGPDNPPGRKYIEEKIAEARAAAEKALRPPGPDAPEPPEPGVPPAPPPSGP